MTFHTAKRRFDFGAQLVLVQSSCAAGRLYLTSPSLCPVGSIACLWWDPIQRLLFSGASDNSIIMWDIGGRKGRTLLLQGHQCVTVCGGGDRIRVCGGGRAAFVVCSCFLKPHLLRQPLTGAHSVPFKCSSVSPD